MLGDLGLYSLILIAVLSTAISALVGWSLLKQSISLRAPTDSNTCINPDSNWFLLLKPITILNACLTIFCLGILALCFYIDDFSLNYVAAHSNSLLPSAFKLAAVWGGHEGSLLFWLFTLTCWGGLVSLNKSLPSAYLHRVLWVMNLLIMAFAWFCLLSSNPFLQSLNPPLEGRDLNPMLQDVGLIFHPPLLYLGYVGFSVVLAFALGALLTRKIEFNWVLYCRYWLFSAWSFLTAGIILGSWWAYYELGWGGWWFWDPVENASLLPWLTSTALLHSIITTRRKQHFQSWSFSLAFVTFSLSILGTFIVRSGVLTSVHAFAVDPSKGVALLIILTVTLLFSFSLLIWRIDELKRTRILSLLSSSFHLFIASGLMACTTLIVLFGTFYPMVYELLGLGNVSVGAPYFNLFFAPLAVLCLYFMALIPALKRLRQAQPTAYVKECALLLASCGLSVVIGYFLYSSQVEYMQTQVLLTWIGAVWLGLTHIGFAAKKNAAMTLAHIGIAVLCIGAAMNANHSYEMNKRMEPGGVYQFEDWQIHFQQTDYVVGPNYTAEKAKLVVCNIDQKCAQVIPERRHYQVRVMNMSEPAMKWFWHGDIYITLGEKVDLTSYAVRVQYKSYVRWIWFGAFLSMSSIFLCFPFSKRQSAKVLRKYVKMA